MNIIHYYVKKTALKTKKQDTYITSLCGEKINKQDIKTNTNRFLSNITCNKCINIIRKNINGK